MYGLSGWPGSGLEGGARAAEGVVTQLEHLERLGLTELGRYKALLVRIRASARARARVRVRVGVRARVGVRVRARARVRARVGGIQRSVCGCSSRPHDPPSYLVRVAAKV